MRELSFSLVTVRALCSGAWAHYPQGLWPPRSTTLNDMNSMETLTVQEREIVLRDRMENGHGPIQSARTMPKGARNSCSGVS